MIQKEKVRNLELTAYENFNLECENVTVPLKSYLQETQRLVKVLAGKNLIEKISEFEFRFHMKTLNFVNIYSFQPIVTIKVLPDKKGTVSFESQDFEMIGINYINHNFSLKFQGKLFSQEKNNKIFLQGQAYLTSSLDLPSNLWIIPKSILQKAGDTLLKNILERIRHSLSNELLHDYEHWASLQKK
ncbi:DUF1997 domain-containing protein [Candidatus Atelocyanobacterium thalassae]|uniref:DUF1997 domain-containing protein n=1 Tax=cyanobacterium endosymbiont of Braarudosphaera bigelowii TaxID=1285375 RepID=A0ABN6JZ83_9CHRO|nr:DUF1997 domain-containing protein [Candidatus Atelocyanobacterium thalassa]BDA39735.1 hypothetical protein CPARK_000057500 [cyanobacterium endosymbiont of Braarudosphaera bigelowii]